MSARCRDGHESSELDYCSVCGVQMPPSEAAKPSVATSATSSPTSGASVCPSCGEPRAEADARFCEVCRYDFVSGQPGKPAVKAVVGRAATPAAAIVPKAATTTFQLIVMVDETLDTEPDPATPCPKGKPSETVPMDREEILVGRRDDRRDIRPDLALDDPGASRRHAKFVKSADGSIALQDLASTNGTRLNGSDVVAGSRSPLKEGDEVAIGRWTRIRLQGVR